jgi:proline racemase
MPGSLRVIDTHTGGEPTRVVIAGGPDLGSGSVAQRQERFQSQFDHYRRALVLEPRGSEVMVGALVLQSVNPQGDYGVIFFNNVGYLGMCGHGTIGVMAALRFLGAIDSGAHNLQTSVGQVRVTVHDAHRVSIQNVISYRREANVALNIEGLGLVFGDVAWGGNWFFLTKSCDIPIRTERVGDLTHWAIRIRQAVHAAGFAEVDHIELFGKPGDPPTSDVGPADSRNFVLCPGLAYDRSPCGTGTSAKLACLAAEGQLSEGEVWVQESIVGSRFEGSFQWADRPQGKILPCITGQAFVNGVTDIYFDPDDPYAWGIGIPSSLETKGRGGP